MGNLVIKINNLELIYEYRFHPKRRWRFDLAIPEHKIAIEIEGGAWSNGRHTRGKGFIKDMEKYNAATVLGWKVLRYTPQQFRNYVFIKDVEQIINPNHDYQSNSE